MDKTACGTGNNRTFSRFLRENFNELPEKKQILYGIGGTALLLSGYIFNAHEASIVVHQAVLKHDIIAVVLGTPALTGFLYVGANIANVYERFKRGLPNPPSRPKIWQKCQINKTLLEVKVGKLYKLSTERFKYQYLHKYTI